jgi:hypothetical protein
MKTLNLEPEDLYILQRAKEEELEDEFYDWLQSHFSSPDIKYLNLIIDKIDDKTFLDIAEQWAENAMKSKIYY